MQIITVKFSPVSCYFLFVRYLISKTFSSQKCPVSKNIRMLKESVCHLQIKWELSCYQ